MLWGELRSKTTRPLSGFSEQWKLIHAHPSSPAGPGNGNPQSRYSTRSKEVTAQAAEASPWFPAKGGCQGWLWTSQVKVQDTVQALGMEGGDGIKHVEPAQKMCECMHLERKYNVCCYWYEWRKKETEFTWPRKVKIKALAIVIIPLVVLHEQLLHCTKP